MLTGTLTLNPLALDATCDAVYLLDDATIPPDGSVLYEATFNGVAWIQVPPGEITAIGHSGTTLTVRATLTLADASGNKGAIRWFIAYATLGA